MSADIIGNFSPLDELIQLIYQSIYQFVVMSSVSYDKWTVHVGMVGDAGRWWCGVWEEKDVVGVVGPKPSDKLLETFVDRLVDSIVGGELYLAGFSTEKGAKIKLTFGPGSSRPVSMDLEEIEPVAAAAHATNVFLEIALQAQSRKCRLHPSTFTAATVSSSTKRAGGPSGTSGAEASRSYTGRVRDIGSAAENASGGSITSRPKTPEPETREVEMQDVEHETNPSRKEDKERQKKRLHSPPEKPQPSAQPKGPTRSAKAASLMNPNKKARKFQAIDFESDDEREG